MEAQVEMEICANCKREIPQSNYVMHTVHCARNIVLCSICKEPIAKSDLNEHRQKCVEPAKPVKKDPPSKLEESVYFRARKEIEDKKASDRQTKRLERLEKLIGSTNLSGHVSPKLMVAVPKIQPELTGAVSKTQPELTGAGSKTTGAVPKVFPACNYAVPIGSSKSSLIPCQYCELELPKLDLQDHETYCGARTETCEVCGENVMFKDRNAHKESNHIRVRKPVREVAVSQSTEKLESSREISRRLDCKTEYIRNLLHDSASITAPLRSSGAVWRNRDLTRRRNPPTEIVIPCEFCNTPVPHEDLIEHETGCRPDLARYNLRRREASPECRYPEPSSPDVDIPCEFCSDLIPASEFLHHQASCSCN